MSIFDQAWEVVRDIKHVSSRFCNFKASHINRLPEWMKWQIRQNLIDLEIMNQMIIDELME